MRSTFISTIMLVITITMICGCSRNNASPSAPLMPDDNAWRDATAFSGSSTDNEKYWNESLIVKNQVWLAHRNTNGTIGYALGPGVDVSSHPLDAVAELENIFLLPPEDFIVQSDEVHAGLRIVFLRQYYKGLRVWPSMAQLVWGRGGKLIKAIADVFPIGELNVTPSITSQQAVSVVYAETAGSTLESSDLVIYAADNSRFLAYRVKTQGWIHYINSLDGTVLARTHLQWDSNYSGHVEGYASQPNPHEPELIYDFTNLELRVRVDPGEPYPTSYLPWTNIEGLYSFDASEQQLQAELRFFGPWMNINNMNNYPNNEASIKRDIFPDTSEEWLLDDSNSLRDERTVYYWANHAWDYLKDIDPTGHEMDWRLTGYVQNGAWCNAYADNYSINFFKASGDCINLGYIPDVIVHEWGHVHMYNQYGDDQPSDAVHEGNADTIANTICDSRYIGWGAQGPDTYFRDSDNELKWPLDECGGECHCLGRLLAGAFWDLREIVGRDYHDYLWHFCKYMHPKSFQEYGADVVIMDDDDDNPLNGSPNYPSIYQCWEINHNLDIPDATDIPTEGVIIDVIPMNPQIRIHRSQLSKHINYHLVIKNLDTEQNWVSIWTACELPWDAVYGPMIPPSVERHSPLRFTIEPEQVMEFDIHHNLPDFVPCGEYVYHVRIGQYVDNIHDVLDDDARFSFWVVP